MLLLPRSDESGGGQSFVSVCGSARPARTVRRSGPAAPGSPRWPDRLSAILTAPKLLKPQASSDQRPLLSAGRNDNVDVDRLDCYNRLEVAGHRPAGRPQASGTERSDFSRPESRKHGWKTCRFLKYTANASALTSGRDRCCRQRVCASPPDGRDFTLLT